MMDPDGTVGLVAFVTVPTTRPAPVIAVVADDCGEPTTSGTETGGPRETTRLTALPCVTCRPAEGLSLITKPAVTVELVVVVTVPTTRPAPVIAPDAAACVMPTTFGTAT